MNFKYNQSNNTISLLGGNVLHQILKNRGIENPIQFLNLGEHNIEDYKLYDNMMAGLQLLSNYINNNSHIKILIDYDTDGYTSGSTIYLYLKQLCRHLNKEFNVGYLLHKTKEHGLTKDIMNEIKKEQCDLLIIPDAASNDFKQHKELKSIGIDILILDHHKCNIGYSDDALVINNQLSNKIKNKAMTGVGVVYKFCKGLDEKFNVNFADNYLDLLAIGMIGDSADLRDLESRYLVLKGIELIQRKENKNKFITKIFENKSYSMNSKVTISNIAFYMCPFINCIIRGGDFEDKSLLFKAFIGDDGVYEDKIRGKGIVQMGIEDYMVRRYTKLYKLQSNLTKEGVELLSKQIDSFNLNENEILVVNGQELNNTQYNRVIVNKISSKYHKHCILLREFNENELRGSATQYKNKDITNLRMWCTNTNLFNFAEGHDAAFGVGINKNQINNLYDLISKIPSSNTLTYNVDGVFNEKTFNRELVSLIGKYDYIWGNKLDEPLFAIEFPLNSNDINLIGSKKNTIKFIYNCVEFVLFNTNEELYNELTKNEANKITIIGKFKINQYKNNISPQVVIEDIDFEPTKLIKKFVF